MNRFIVYTTCMVLLLAGLVTQVGVAQETKADQPIPSEVRVVRICVKAWCINSPSLVAYGVGCHTDTDLARAQAQNAAAALLNCPPNQIVYADRTCSPVTQCPETMALKSSASAAVWKVVYRCCCRDGKIILVPGHGNSLCDALKNAKAEACWIATHEHCGIRYCSWRVVEKPCCCTSCCR